MGKGKGGICMGMGKGGICMGKIVLNFRHQVKWVPASITFLIFLPHHF